jgi:hypothetical protein
MACPSKRGDSRKSNAVNTRKAQRGETARQPGGAMRQKAGDEEWVRRGGATGAPRAGGNKREASESECHEVAGGGKEREEEVRGSGVHPQFRSPSHLFHSLISFRHHQFTESGTISEHCRFHAVRTFSAENRCQAFARISTALEGGTPMLPISHARRVNSARVKWLERVGRARAGGGWGEQMRARHRALARIPATSRCGGHCTD